MGFPSVCDECGNKLKVFGTKKKCKYCKDVVCKACVTIHLELRHSNEHRRRQSLGTFDKPKDGNVVPSPIRSSPSRMESSESVESSVLDRIDGVEAVSDEEDDGELYDDETDQEEEMLLTTLSRQSTMEETSMQYQELCKMQEAVATWAMKEKQAKRAMKEDADEHWTLVFPLVGHTQHVCSASSVCYVVSATVMVWTVCGLVLALYLRARSLLAGSTTYVHMP